ncbi:MAG: hypothetical protein CL927_01755 [Deltaproteobacteria bacterium]|nr:hypothetical protein [Deltaproteobacteria bacterium]HCH62916.1 hypothetical protein [Deltaproteobacteria bacterium]
MTIPKQTDPPEGPLAPLRFIDVHARDLSRVADSLVEMLDMRLTGVIVREAFPKAALQAAVAHLSATPAPVRAWDIRCFGDREPETQDPRYAGFSFGMSLTNSFADLSLYLASSAQMVAALPELFGGSYDFLAELQRILSVIAGRPVAPMPAPNGATYAPVSARRLLEGATLTIHRGNEFFDWPSNHDLVQRVDTRDQISFFTPLQPPPAGGALHIYPGYFPPPQREHLEVKSARELAEADRQMQVTVLNPEAGDLVVFDGGRYLHRVTAAHGGERWTIGGFVCPTPDAERVWMWA